MIDNEISIVDLLNKSPRTEWASILKPYIIKEEDGYLLFKDLDYDHAAFRLEELNPNYIASYNIGDIIIDNKDHKRWIVIDTSVIDARSYKDYENMNIDVFILMLVDVGNHIPILSLDPITGEIIDGRYTYIDETNYTRCTSGRNEVEEKLMQENILAGVPIKCKTFW